MDGTRENIKKIIADGDLEGAIDEMTTLFKTHQSYDEVVFQKSRYNDIKNQIRKGLLKQEDISIEKNKIRSALLELLRDLPKEKKRLPKASESSGNVSSPNERNKSNWRKKVIGIGIVILLSSFCIVAYNFWRTEIKTDNEIAENSKDIIQEKDKPNTDQTKQENYTKLDELVKSLNAELESSQERNLSKGVIQRIVLFTNSLETDKEYSFDGSTKAKKVSSLKGELFRILQELDINELSLAEIFSKADFSKTYMENLNIDKAFLNGIKLNNSIIIGCKFKGGSFINSSLNNSDIVNTNFSQSIMDGSSMKGVTMDSISLSEVKCNSCIFDKARIKGINTWNANFRNSNFTQVYFSGCDLSATDFSNSYLNFAQFNSTHLYSSIFYNAELHDTDFSTADVFDEYRYENYSLDITSFACANVHQGFLKESFGTKHQDYEKLIKSYYVEICATLEEAPGKNSHSCWAVQSRTKNSDCPCSSCAI